MADSPDIASLMQQLQGSSASAAGLPEAAATPGLLPNGKKTKGRVKIKMEYIGNKLRRYTTFSKRKTGIMKKAYELSTLTGTQVMLLVASETGHVYTYATKKLQPMISSEAGKNLIQSCLSSPSDDGLDLQPSRTEFTFETGCAVANPRKRKMNDGAADTNTTSMSSFLPTMVPTALFSNFNEEDYNADSGDDTDSEEPSEGKEETREAESKTASSASQAELAATLQQTIKDALREAASTRQQQQKKQRTQPMHNISNPGNAFLAPFLMAGLTGSQSANQTTNFQQHNNGLLNKSSPTTEGGANAGSVFMNSSKGEEAGTANPLLSFPFAFNIQQFMESAALSAQIANSE